ncbi:MAG: response regulator [Sporocytophaga sp.]|nr:response regulator [Sporocytophaga sp.]
MKHTTGLLYVDSEQHNLNAFRAYFREFKEYNMHLFRTGIDALFALHTEKIDIIIADQTRPEVTGFEFVSAARFKDSPPLIIALTVHPDTSTLDLAMEQGTLFRYFGKPVDFQELHLALIDAKLTMINRPDNQ